MLGWLTATSCDAGEPSFDFAVSVRVDADDVTLHAPNGTVAVDPDNGMPYWIAKTEYPDYETAREQGILLETRRNGELLDMRTQLARDCSWPDSAPPREGLLIFSIFVDVDGRFDSQGPCSLCYGGDVGVQVCP